MSAAPLTDLDANRLSEMRTQLRARLDQLAGAELALDLTRGKPAPDQLALSDALDGILAGDYRASDGTDTRNYGGLRGIPEARALGGPRPETRADASPARNRRDGFGGMWGIDLAGRTGLEPATSGVTGQCSNQLNYRPGGSCG